MHPHHTVIGWYPWEPVRSLIVGRQLGKGRAIYIAGEIDAKEAAQQMDESAAKWRRENPDAVELYRKTALDWIQQSK